MTIRNVHRSIIYDIVDNWEPPKCYRKKVNRFGDITHGIVQLLKIVLTVDVKSYLKRVMKRTGCKTLSTV